MYKSIDVILSSVHTCLCARQWNLPLSAIGDGCLILAAAGVRLVKFRGCVQGVTQKYFHKSSLNCAK